ncbi:MAG: M56 family metallopeptidase [Lachnospiraceae bacterium]|nr:M56 family metallopeptidase [Lachnospiraceae bacterium]
MFYDLFVRLMNRSMTASVVIAAVLIVRAFMGKMPKRYSYVLWLIVAFRLLCPVGLASPLSVFNLLGEHYVLREEYQQESAAGSGIGQQQDSNIEKQQDDFISMDENEGYYLAQEAGFRGESLFEGKVDTEEISPFVRYGTIAWLSIAAILKTWNIMSLFLMKRKVSSAIRFRDNVYECDGIPTPFVMGFISPKIYIPFRLDEEEREYIIKHERHHIDRRDNIVKLIAVLITCIYWFHPLVWISYFFMIRDMEMSCDEYVLQESMRDIREDYSRSLLAFATNQRNAGMGLIAFGESDARKRVQHIMKFKKCGKWIGMAAIGLVIAAGVVCLTDAKESGINKIFQLDDPLIKELKIKNGSSFQIDSYTISLEDGIYEENTQLGHLIFKVTNAKGAVEAEITSSNQLNGNNFGKDGRFSILIMGTHGQTIYAKYEGDILYISYEFEAKDYLYDNLNNSICLKDYKMRTESGEFGKEYYFSLDTVEHSKQIQMGKDGTIYISSLGFLVVSERKYTIDDMKIVLTDGSEKNIIDKKDYSVPLSASNVDIGEKLSFGYNQFFKEYIDCSRIDTLIYNGKSYKVSN